MGGSFTGGATDEPCGDAVGEDGGGPAVALGPLDTLVFHALRRAQGRVLDDLQAAFAAQDMRPLPFAILVVLGRNPGLRQNQVGFALDIQRTNLVPLLDGLERQGLAERRAVPGDRRARGLFLTKLGAETLARLEAVAAAHEARLEAALGAQGRAQLLALLRRLGERWPGEA
jgi:DNA-binding MarR family transcriptional regulator